jgi:glycosyl transferase family 25
MIAGLRVILSSMKIAVINLARSEDRRKLIQAGFVRLGLGFEFFPGIDAWRGEHVRFSQYNARVPSDFFRPLAAGEIGCFASHYLLWQRCMESREPLVILEDDVEIDDGFVRALETATDLLPTFPLVRLGITREGAGTAPILSLPSGFELVSLESGTFGCQCYMLSDVGAKALFEHATVWSMPVDIYMDRPLIHGIGSYGLRPYFVRHADQTAYPSVIGDERYGALPQDRDSKVKSLVERFLAERGHKRK